MATKRKPKQSTIDGPVKEEGTPMSLYVPTNLHKRLKIAAVHEGMTMNALIRKWIEKGLKEIGG